MSWLFGSKPAQQKKAAPNVDQLLQSIGMQIDNISKRQKLLEAKAASLTQEALKLKKGKNVKGAILALKKKKLIDQELNKIDGMKMLMEQQRLQFEGIL